MQTEKLLRQHKQIRTLWLFFKDATVKYKMKKKKKSNKGLPSAFGGSGVALDIGGPEGGGVAFMVGGGPVGGGP